jgi:hypothetical protein
MKHKINIYGEKQPETANILVTAQIILLPREC